MDFEKIKKIFWFVTGFIFFVLAWVGFMMPVLPGTIFMVIAAFCFMKSSKKFYNWIINNRWFGKQIKDYHDGNGMTVKSKIMTMFTVWMTVLSAVLFVSQLWWAKIILIIFVVGVTIHILDQKTIKK